MNCKALGERHGEALEVVVLDELVQVDAQHFERYAHVAAEREAVFYAHDVLDVVAVVVAQGLQYFDFNFALLMQLLPVLEDLDGHCFLGLVVYALQHHSERTSPQLLHDLIPVVYLVFSLVDVVCLVVVEAEVVNAVDLLLLRVFVLASQLAFVVPADAFVLRIEVDVVNHIEVHHLFFLVLTQQFAIVPNHVFRRHWELRGTAASHLVLLRTLSAISLLKRILASRNSSNTPFGLGVLHYNVVAFYFG